MKQRVLLVLACDWSVPTMALPGLYLSHIFDHKKGNQWANIQGLFQFTNQSVTLLCPFLIHSLWLVENNLGDVSIKNTNQIDEEKMKRHARDSGREETLLRLLSQLNNLSAHTYVKKFDCDRSTYIIQQRKRTNVNELLPIQRPEGLQSVVWYFCQVYYYWTVSGLKK